MADTGFCQERSGFLFSHDCDCLAGHACASCGKAICDRHMHETETGTVCTTCAKKVRRQERQTRRGHGYYDDPYFYSHYYHGYGRYHHGYWGYHHHHSAVHDRDDFTEADGESVGVEGAEAFEQDMGAS